MNREKMAVLAVGLLVAGAWAGEGPAQTNLIAAWSFDEGAGLVARDGAGKINGTLVAAQDVVITNAKIRGVRGQWTLLKHREIVPGSETVRDPAGAAVYVRGRDYEMDYADGRIQTLAGVNLPETCELVMDYTCNNSGPGWVEGKKGGALHFDGRDDQVNIVWPKDLNFGADDSFTIEAWVRPEYMAGFADIVAKGPYSNGNVLLEICRGKYARFLLRSAGKYSLATGTSTNLLDGQWHFIAGVRDARKRRVKLYVDGKFESDVREKGDFNICPVNYPFTIGVGGYGNKNYYRGLIDEVKIFSGAKSADELLGDMVSVAAAPLQVKVAIYQDKGTFGAEGIYAALQSVKGLTVGLIGNFSEATLLSNNVVVLPSISSLEHQPGGWRSRLRAYVAAGHGVLLCHDSVGFRKALAEPLFPEIEKGLAKSNTREMVVKDSSHPICRGLPAEFKHAYWDHIVMEAAPAGAILMVDKDGQPVVVAGSFGAGRVAAIGNLCGCDEATHDRAPEGGELQLLLNAVAWLAEPAPAGKDTYEFQVRKEKVKLDLRARREAAMNQVVLAGHRLETKLDFAMFDLEDLEGRLEAGKTGDLRQRLEGLRQAAADKLASLRQTLAKEFDDSLMRLDGLRDDSELRAFQPLLDSLSKPTAIGYRGLERPPWSTAAASEQAWLPEVKKVKDEIETLLASQAMQLAALAENAAPAAPPVPRPNKDWLKDTFIITFANAGLPLPGWREAIRYMGRNGVDILLDNFVFRMSSDDVVRDRSGLDRMEYLQAEAELTARYGMKLFIGPGGGYFHLPENLPPYPEVGGLVNPEYFETYKRLVQHILDRCSPYPSFGGIEEDELNAWTLLPEGRYSIFGKKRKRTAIVPGEAADDKQPADGKDSRQEQYITTKFREYLTHKYSRRELADLDIPAVDTVAVPRNKDKDAAPALWMEYQEFVAHAFETYWREIWRHAHDLDANFISYPLVSPGPVFSTPFACRMSALADMADMIAIDLYWVGAPAEAFGLDLLRANAKGPIQQTVGVYYGGNHETYRRDLAMTYAHTQGAYIFSWDGCFKQGRLDWPAMRNRCIDTPENMWDATVEFCERAKKIEPWLVRTASASQIALLFSERSAALDSNTPGFGWGGYTVNQIGLYLALVQSHVQCDPIYAEYLTPERLEAYKVLIVSDTQALTDADLQAIRDWVGRGGCLVATGASSLRDRWGRAQKDYQLGDVFGVSYQATTQSVQNIVLDALAPVAFNAGAYDLVSPAGGQVVSSWETGEPAVVSNRYGKGLAMFLSVHQPGRSFIGERDSQKAILNRKVVFEPGVREFLADLVNTGLAGAGGRPIVAAVACPDDVEIHLRRQEQGARRIIHLLNYSLTNVPVKNMELTLPVASDKVDVFYGEDRAPVESKVEEGMLKLRLRPFEIYEMVVVEGGTP